jgi:hypothetical protein
MVASSLALAPLAPLAALVIAPTIPAAPWPVTPFSHREPCQGH